MRDGGRKKKKEDGGDMRERGGYRNRKGEEKHSAPTEERT